MVVCFLSLFVVSFAVFGGDFFFLPVGVVYFYILVWFSFLVQRDGVVTYFRRGCLGRLLVIQRWRGRGYDDCVPGEVTITTPSGDRTT